VAAKLGASRFVTQSMLFGYGYGRAPDRVLTETDPFAPTGEGKFEQHLAAMRINESVVLGSDQFDGIALRYGLFYGVGAGDSELVKALRRRAMPVARSARPLSWIYIDDAVTATVAALEHGRGGQAYNVVDDEPATWTQMMTELAKQIGAKPPVALPGWALAAMPYAREVMRGGVRASNARAKAELGWSPAFPTFRDGVAQIAAAFAGRPSAASA
jgi:nucleoside-diphosphate-sugar epimerase